MLYKCKDCKGPGYGAMVQNHVWRLAGLKRGFLCVPCIERRVGFRLCKYDLIPCSLTCDDPLVAHLIGGDNG